ncbi:serine/threonine-protein kinase 32A isoform X2 [Rhopalosiphum maidis]|uniref:serine/threonine-protein kinase 32A isoform X2 n=1 Tax=Rhopalosiphum maidis TaxID=43146 RepID=UPI000EFE8171|nr:serine/threonine-protein kinase 32A isoform X2 [Rhopalosiphum maidis]
MGVGHSNRQDRSCPLDGDVNFDHFEILRAIGKGSFGKVCIVEKKNSRQMYAMKYMQKSRCIERDALKNVLREMEILTTLEHPFLVNLWFSFQDEEDLFMVSDLLLGGDLRYHLGQDVKFSENSIKLFACEIGSALEYLQSEHIVHRDIKPENILLDEEGHAHITDFNIAATLHGKKLASSLSGTKPYIAPEVYLCSLGECAGYSYPVDWWSLGVTLYEVMSRCRPYDIHSGTTPREVRSMLINSTASTAIPPKCSEQLSVLFQRLLCINPEERITTVKKLKSIPCISRYNFGMILEKQIRPPFTPPKDRLNCDPTFELEEMIVEPNPLHRKPRRLAKQRSLRTSMTIEDTETSRQLQHFKCYNREKELERREMERKEHDWEQELIKAMNASTIPAIVPAMVTDRDGGGDLLTVPIMSTERRRSSCKLNISPVSIQTRLFSAQADTGS